MVFKRMVMVGALAAGLVAAAPARMQEAPWSGFLYNSFENTLVQVTEAGQTQEIRLAVPEGSFLGGRDLAFSADGSIRAFCALMSTETGSTARLTIEAADPAGSPVIELEMPEAAACQPTFSDSGELMVLALLSSTGDQSEPFSWQLTVMSARDGVTQSTLTSAEMPEGDQPWPRGLVIPIVRHFDGREVTFALYPYATEGPAVVPSYRWSTDTGAITPIEGWGNLFQDYLPETGELAYAVEDQSLPMGNPGGPMPSSNVVRVQSADGTARNVYLSGADWVIGSLGFVDGGRSLAIQLIQSWDFEQPDMHQAVRWILLDRAGNTTDVPFEADFLDVVGATDGYAVLLADNVNGEGTPVISFHRVTAAGQSELWSTTPGSFGVTWDLAWSTPLVAAPDLPPFAEA